MTNNRKLSFELLRSMPPPHATDDDYLADFASGIVSALRKPTSAETEAGRIIAYLLLERAALAAAGTCEHDGGRDHYSETHSRCWKCGTLIPYPASGTEPTREPSLDEIAEAIYERLGGDVGRGDCRYAAEGVQALKGSKCEL
jgi:hypothetical protein